MTCALTQGTVYGTPSITITGTGLTVPLALYCYWHIDMGLMAPVALLQGGRVIDRLLRPARPYR